VDRRSLNRAFTEGSVVGPVFTFATTDDQLEDVRQWAQGLPDDAVICFFDSRDHAGATRVREQVLAIAGRPGRWALGQTWTEGSPRSAIYPDEYVFRDASLLETRSVEYSRGSLAVQVRELREISGRLDVGSGSLVGLLLPELDVPSLIELPMQVAALRDRAPTCDTRRVAFARLYRTRVRPTLSSMKMRLRQPFRERGTP
jgi:hypothetical protein